MYYRPGCTQRARPERRSAKMRYVSSALVLLAAVVMQAPSAHAATTTFGGNLFGANEVPPTDSPATGSVKVVLDPTAQTIEITGAFSGLTTPIPRRTSIAARRSGPMSG